MNEQLAAVLIEVIKSLSGLDVSIFLVVLVILPWISMLWLLITWQRYAKQQFTVSQASLNAIAKQLFDLAGKNDNMTQLVRQYETLTRDHKATIDTMLQYVRENTQALNAIAERLRFERR